MLVFTRTCNNSYAFWHMYKNGEKVGESEKGTPNGSRRSLRRGRKEAEVFFKPPEGKPRHLQMAPQSVRKRKRQNHDVYNSS